MSIGSRDWALSPLEVGGTASPVWQITNTTPYSVARSWTRGARGEHVWLVAVKATFALGAQGVRLAEKQPEPLLLPEHRGEPASSSLRYEADLTDEKPKTDIVINGTAYSPKGRPHAEILVGARIGAIQKGLKVVGDRVWDRSLAGIRLSAPKPFTSMPIVYERAYGGADLRDPDPQKHRHEARNPIGCGFALKKDHRVGMSAPNILSLEGDGLTQPVGFGPIPSHWSPRHEHWGTFDEAWIRERKPLLPTDYRAAALQCAPDDQQSGAPMVGGESVRLINLTPSGQLDFVLPRIQLTFQTRFGARRIRHEGRLHTVVIEPDELALRMTWLARLECHDDAESLDETLVRQVKATSP